MSALLMCPVCGSENLVQERNKKDYVEIRGEKVEVESNATTCKNCGESYATFEDELDLIERARVIYRAKHDIPSPLQISDFMKHHRFSLRDLEKLTGIAFKTIDRYLRSAIPDPSNARLLNIFIKYPEVLLDTINASVDFSNKKYDRVRKDLEAVIEEIKRSECAECVFSRARTSATLPSKYPNNLVWDNKKERNTEPSWPKITQNTQDSLAA